MAGRIVLMHFIGVQSCVITNSGTRRFWEFRLLFLVRLWYSPFTFFSQGSIAAVHKVFTFEAAFPAVAYVAAPTEFPAVLHVAVPAAFPAARHVAAPAAFPAARPVLQAICRLKPPVNASTSSTSPAK